MAVLAILALAGCGSVKGDPADAAGVDDADVTDADVTDDALTIDAPPSDGTPPLDAPPAAPTVSSITPDWGSMDGGTSVTITGTNLDVGGLTVRFGTATATVTPVSATMATAVAPAGPHQAVTVQVMTAGGSANAPAPFRYLAPLYAADGRGGTMGNLYRLNPTNAAATTIGAIGFGITGMAIHPTTGVLYGATNTPSGQPRLVTINPYTGAATEIGRLQTPAGVATLCNDITWLGNRLLGWKGRTMIEVNPSSGQTAVFGDAGVGGVGNGIAASSTTVRWAPARGSGILYTVNASNGSVAAGPTMNGPSHFINGMTFNGTSLYAVFLSPAGAGQTATLYRINPANGVTTLVGTAPIQTDALAGLP